MAMVLNADQSWWQMHMFVVSNHRQPLLWLTCVISHDGWSRSGNEKRLKWLRRTGAGHERGYISSTETRIWTKYGFRLGFLQARVDGVPWFSAQMFTNYLAFTSSKLLDERHAEMLNTGRNSRGVMPTVGSSYQPCYFLFYLDTAEPQLHKMAENGSTSDHVCETHHH